MSDLLAALRSALGDRYRIDRELSGGGMSRVFVAEELALGRSVVLKVLPPDAAATVNADRFRREVQFAAKLQHPHIVPVLATGEDAGTLWYSMPFVDGDTLRGRLASGPMELRDALTFWQHMLDALAHAHKAGIVHRDMKPDNVLVSGRNALVTDFGIAKAVASATAGATASGLTGVGFVVGTPAYMAPEQAAGMEQVDARTDLYATALVAYEMLTGKAAFGGLTPPQTLAAQVQTMPAAPRTVNPTVPAAVEALLMQCLAKDPAARPASADAVCDALDAIVRGVGTPSRETAAAPPAPRRARRVGAMIGVLAALSVIFVFSRNRKAAPTDQPRDLVVLASFAHEPKDSSVARALSEAFRIDLQQSPRLRVADPQLMRTTLQTMRLDPSANITDSIAKALGTRLGAKAYVTGSLSALGTGFVLTARLVSVADGSEVAALREAADAPSQLLDATDRLSKALREKAGESVASLRASPALPAATTSNLEALEYYAAGQSYGREGKQLQALAAYERAVAIDSMFASAWSGIGTSLGNMQLRPADRLRASRRAFELREKLPELERLRIESRYYASRGETQQEIAALQRTLAIDPTSYATLNNLGRLMLGRREYPAAESLLKAATRAQPGTLAPAEMLFTVAVETGNNRLLDSMTRATPKGDLGVRWRLARLTTVAVADARYPQMAMQLDSALSANPDMEIQGQLIGPRFLLYYMQGQIRSADRVLELNVAPVANQVDPAIVPSIQLDLAKARGRFFDDSLGARRLISKAETFYLKQTDLQNRAILNRAITHTFAHDLKSARQTLTELTTVLPKDSLFLRYVRGEIALAEGNYQEAVRLLRSTIGPELFCGICGSGGLARAYDALGQRDSVLAVYTRLLNSRETGGRFTEDAFERAQALKRVGELLEERGDVEGALVRYRQFVELWDKADVELQPIVRDVRERIARLAGRKG